MKVKITVNEKDYFEKLLMLLSHMPPFNRVYPRELELYAKLLRLDYQYSRMPFEDRQLKIFISDFDDIRKQLSEDMGVESTAIYNMLRGLCRAGIMKKNSLIPKYVLPKTKELTFVFEEEEQ